MQITMELAFSEGSAVRLLNWLATENAIIFRSMPHIGGVYDYPHIRYEREKREEWADILNLILKGHEDCDALAAARAGEIQARGYRALVPSRQDAGWRAAHTFKPRRIPARVVLRTRLENGQPGLYHCIVKYEIAGRTFYDDPSARLGMFGYRSPLQPHISLPEILRRNAA